MPLTVELSINNRSLGSAFIRNIGRVTADEENDLTRYSYAIFPSSTTHTGVPAAKGHVHHHRNEGAWALVKRVLEDADLEPFALGRR